MVNGGADHDSDWVLTWLVDQARLIGVERPPSHLRQQLIDLFDNNPSVTTSDDHVDSEHSLDPFEFELAELLFDGRYDLAAAGTRGLGDTDSGYGLAYTASTADVVLHVETSGTTIRIHGQVLAETMAENVTITANASGATAPLGAAVCDDLGRFMFGSLPRTGLDLVVHATAVRLLVRLPYDFDDDLAGT